MRTSDFLAPPSSLERARPRGKRSNHNRVVATADRQTIGLDELFNSKSDLDELVAQLIHPDEPAVVAVLDERVTARW